MTLQEKINKLNESGIYDFYVMDDVSWNEIDSLTKEDLENDETYYQLIQVELLLNDSRGVYIPRGFYQQFDLESWNINKDDYINLNDINSETYWESWEMILNNAFCMLNGKKWQLCQDGDLFAITYL